MFPLIKKKIEGDFESGVLGRRLKYVLVILSLFFRHLFPNEKSTVFDYYPKFDVFFFFFAFLDKSLIWLICQLFIW